MEISNRVFFSLIINCLTLQFITVIPFRATNKMQNYENFMFISTFIHGFFFLLHYFTSSNFLSKVTVPMLTLFISSFETGIVSCKMMPV